MACHGQIVKRIFAALLLLSPAAGLATVGCSEIQPEPNMEGVGEMQSETHEQDTFHEDENRK